MELNKAMKETMRMCYEYISEITGDENPIIKSEMIKELFRAHISERVQGISIMEAMESEENIYDIEDEEEMLWKVPFVSSIGQKANIEFDRRKERVKRICLENKKVVDFDVVFEEGCVFGNADDIEELKRSDLIIRVLGGGYYIITGDAGIADGGFLGVDVKAIEKTTTNNDFVLNLLNNILDDGIIDKKEYLNKLHCIFDITKSMVEVSGDKLSEKKGNVFLSFAAENNIVYCWDVKSKIQSSKDKMQKGDLIKIKEGRKTHCYRVSDIDNIEIDKNNIQNIYYLRLR